MSDEGDAYLYAIGTAVKKHFDGHGLFSGSIVSRRKVEDSLWYMIRYEDNDEEEIEQDDIGDILVKTTPSKKRASGAKKKKQPPIEIVDSDDEEEEDEPLVTPAIKVKKRKAVTSSASKSTKASRGVTPSPAMCLEENDMEVEDVAPPAKKIAAKHAATSRKRKKKDDADAETKKSKYFEGSAAAAKRSSSLEYGGSDDQEDSSGVDDWDLPLAALKRKAAAKKAVQKSAASAKPAAKKQPAAAKETEKKASPKKKATPKKKAPAAPKTPPSGPPLIMASDTDSDDEKDRPFRVEYSKTGRSTCRGCDERIEKGVPRICSRPLFRGKPGFVVYRHLQCQILPEEIETIQDVGGYRRLNKDDRDLLEQRIAKSKEEIQQEKEELHADELVQTTFQGELRKAPPGLSASLLPFQQEGVSWMYDQEVNQKDVKGGILADEMGMGKTLQSISVILDNRPKLQHASPGAKHPPGATNIEQLKSEEVLWADTLKDCHHALDMAGVPQSVLKTKKKKGAVPIGVRAGTLVVVPVIAIYQWQEEIKKFTEENALTVCIYHGSDRLAKFPREMLAKYDIILTTYQVLEADFRKMVSPNKVSCPNCQRKFKIDKLAVHLKYFCGETAQRTEAQSRQRRTADRHQRPAQNNNRGGSVPRRHFHHRKRKGSQGDGNGGKKTFKTKQSTKTKKPLGKTVAKKIVRAKASKNYDSDSELSVPEDFDVTSSRPSRSAATQAKKKMTQSSKEWGDGPASDSDAFSEESSDESSSDEESVAPKKAPSANRKKVKEQPPSEDSDSESSDDEVVARARKRQKLAMSRIKKVPVGKGKKKFKATPKGKKTAGKKKMPDEYSSDSESDDDSFDEKAVVKGKKKFKVPAKRKAATTKKKKSAGKKKMPDDYSSDSSSDEDEDDDPLASVDMDALKAEALKGCAVSPLHTMSFWRIILDEAHMIKSRSSQTASAAFHLSAVHRWALSGTPLQNRVGEFYSLIRFLRLDPMAHYFCRRDGCDCKSIYYRMEHGKCKDCGHGSVQHFSHFNKHILNVIQREGYAGDGRRAMMKLKNEVLDKSLLRRTKESRAEDMNLPPRVVTIKAIRLHPREEDFYNALYTQTKSSFNDYVAEGSILNNYAHVFDLLTKMRQAVDHPYLIVHSKKAHAANALNSSQQSEPAVANGSTLCEVCDETPTDRVESTCCGAAFCRSCVMDMMSLENMQQDDGIRCTSCRKPLSIDLNQVQQQVVDDGTLNIDSSMKTRDPSLREISHVPSGSILRRLNLAEFATSTKIEALVQELVQMRQERPGSKALVFSQFVNMLDLVRWRLHSDACLQDLGLGVRIIHGGMNVQSRDEALKDFREDPSVRVLLMSLKAGGVALNLTVANEAYLLDPWWNPAAEMQAIDRTHRLGQHRPIRAIRFIAEGTVEERVLQLQEKKRLVCDGVVGGDARSLTSLSLDDMKALFT